VESWGTNEKVQKKEEKKPCWKHCSNSQCFVMKATVLPHMIKIDKDNFEKNHKKKNYVERHCSNPQCFVRKGTVLSPHD